MISIITVNWNGYEWLQLLIESLELYGSQPPHLVVVDNNTELRNIDCSFVKQIKVGKNIGHGAGLNLGAQYATEPFVMFIDVDCHFLTRNWEIAFLKQMDEYQVVAGRGVPQKPIRPACMFMHKEIALKYDWCSTPGYKGHRVTPEGYDVAIQAYYQMLKDKVKLGFLESTTSRYKTAVGEEWCVEGIPYIFHKWHGTHLKERQVDFPHTNLLADKELFFSQIPWRQV